MDANESTMGMEPDQFTFWMEVLDAGIALDRLISFMFHFQQHAIVEALIHPTAVSREF